MEMKSPHNIVTDPEELSRRKAFGDLFMPLSDEESRMLKNKTVGERSAFLQRRLDSIRNHNKATQSND